MSDHLQHVTTGLEAVEVMVPGITTWDEEDDPDDVVVPGFLRFKRREDDDAKEINRLPGAK